MRYVLIASNGQVVNWNLTMEKAIELKQSYENMYPEEKMQIEEQRW